MTPISSSMGAASSTNWLAAVRPPVRAEVDVPHVVVDGPARSMGRGLGVACWSKWLAVGRAATRIEGDVLRVMLVDPAQSTR
jgi:hypothetical protein